MSPTEDEGQAATSPGGRDGPSDDGRVHPDSRRRPLVVGVISDTHSHLYPEVAGGLEGVDHIIHAGDVGSQQVLDDLRRIAPVTAVRGNVDLGGWADSLPSRAEIELGGVCFVVGHIKPRPDGAGRAGQAVVVVAGHSHMAAKEERGSVLHLNPGSAGPRRFGRPRTMARVEIWPPREGVEPGAAWSVPWVVAEIITVEGD